VAGRLITILALGVALGVAAPSANAATELGDAGDLPASAQDVTPEAVSTISGTLRSPSDVDLYKVCVTGGGSFSASTVGGVAPDAPLDTQLFLFSESGRGVYGNDDAGTGVRQSLLPACDPLTPSVSGIYYLGVSQFDLDPESSLGPIFPSTLGLVGPTGRGGGEPLSSWAGSFGSGGAYTVTLAGTDACGVAPDTTSPVVTIASPVDGLEVELGAEVEIDFSCSDEGGSGLASCEGSVPDGGLLDTSSLGARSVRVTARDNAGNETTASVDYRVGYEFGGFLRPLVNLPELNGWRAGQRVPVRFSLGGAHGLDAVVAVEVAEVECGAGEEPVAGEPARLGRRLTYRARKGLYRFGWRTERAWADSCRQLLVKLDDDSVQRANFRFVRRWHQLQPEND
jgi:hypothetical protein